MWDAFNLNRWDALLVVAVSLMGTALAYLHHPKWKALILSLPIPFTVASLSVGARVNATHVLGLILLLLYTHEVRLLHVRLGFPIVPSIVVSAASYVVAGMVLAQVVPDTEMVFWVGASAALVIAAAILLMTAHRVEPGHRTRLPVWVKLPVIVLVVFLLVISKKLLQGFMTMFPMVGVVAAYEARHSLWTICRQIPVFMLCMVPLLIVAHLAQPRVGMGASLALGWATFLCILLPLTRSMWKANEEAEDGL